MTMEEAREGIGRSVIYTPVHTNAKPEVGTITDVSSLYVFVRYAGQHRAQATPAERLRFEVSS
jgi:hypothetical protein